MELFHSPGLFLFPAIVKMTKSGIKSLGRPKGTVRQTTVVPSSPFFHSGQDNQIVTEAEIDRPYAFSAWADSIWGSIRNIPATSLDEITRQHGPGVWDKLMLDPMIDSGISTIVDSVVNTPPAAVVPLDASPEEQKYAEFVSDSIKACRPFSFMEAARILLRDALKQGNAVHEIVLEEAPWRGGRSRYRLKGLIPIDMCHHRYAVDFYGDLIGVMPTQIGVVPGEMVRKGETNTYEFSNIIPEWKLVHLVYDRQGTHPGGRSLLASVFKPWATKKRLEEYMLIFASRTSKHAWVGKLPPGARCVTKKDPQTGEETKIDPVADMLKIIEEISNGNGAVIPAEADLRNMPIDNTGAGEFYLRALEWCDRQILRGLHGRMMAASGNAANSTEGENDRLILAGIARTTRLWLEGVLTDSISRTLIGVNFGWDKADKAPHISIGSGDGLPVSLTEIGVLHQSGWWTPSQKKAIDRDMGFPSAREDEDVLGVNGRTTKPPKREADDV